MVQEYPAPATCAKFAVFSAWRHIIGVSSRSSRASRSQSLPSYTKEAPFEWSEAADKASLE